MELKERTASQSHFNDLCRLLDIDEPVSADPKGEWFTFEKGASKTSGGEGWADVWRKDCFAWEYKGKRANLDKAFDQLLQYAIALENPPLLIVSDMDVIRIHTNWTNSVQQVHTLHLDDLEDAANRDKLRAAFLKPEVFKPTKTRQLVTEQAAQNFANLAQRLRERGHDPQQVAHFINRLVFCMFAEDVGLLPHKMFEEMIKVSRPKPETFADNAKQLFSAMRSKGGKVGFTHIEWFNGGLFDSDDVIPLEWEDLDDLIRAANLDWSDIDPSILGTLFERGLDPSKRSQLGAHYTDRDKIMQIVNPVIVEPLLAEWAEVKAQIETLLEKTPKATKDKLLSSAQKAAVTRASAKAEALHQVFLERLKAFRVLDPACGSGNFLYISLLELKNIEHRVNLDAEALGLQKGFPQIGPEVVLGIELNTYAAELARVSVWIGEIQWMRRNGFEAAKNPILRSLNTIENRDAITDVYGNEAPWPDADFIVGNPPFLGAKRMKRRLGVAETERIRAAFANRLPGFTDLVCYWFEKARQKIVEGTCQRAGLVATNSIRKNTNLPVVKRINKDTRIFCAWSEEKWTIDGAAVDVSLICFGHSLVSAKLNGSIVSSINPDLTYGLNLTLAGGLAENQSEALLGIQKSGPFDVDGKTARLWLKEPVNPNGSPNREVLKPYWNGDDITGRPRDYWFIDLPRGLTEAEAALFVSPFDHVSTTRDEDGKTVQELRQELGTRAGPRWWEPLWPRPGMRKRIAVADRYIITPETSQYRLFVWQKPPTLPDKNLIVIPRSDDTTFGVLHSIFHQYWSPKKRL